MKMSLEVMGYSDFLIANGLPAYAVFRPTWALCEKTQPYDSFEWTQSVNTAGVPTQGGSTKKTSSSKKVEPFSAFSAMQCHLPIKYMQANIPVRWLCNMNAVILLFTLGLIKGKMFAVVINFQSCKILFVTIVVCAVFGCLILCCPKIDIHFSWRQYLPRLSRLVCWAAGASSRSRATPIISSSTGSSYK